MVNKPRKASTLIVLRRADNGPGVEVLMLLRHHEHKFAPNNYVFPGGAMDDADLNPAFSTMGGGFSLDDAHKAIADLSPRLAYAAFVTAVRETFEESALLLAHGKDGQRVSYQDARMRIKFLTYRERLLKDEISFIDILREESLALDLKALTYFSHWITPAVSPIRYDTRFFMAEAPLGQKVYHDGMEMVKQVWIRPEEALRRYHGGAFNMVFPTVMTLEEFKGMQLTAKEGEPAGRSPKIG